MANLWVQNVKVTESTKTKVPDLLGSGPSIIPDSLFIIYIGYTANLWVQKVKVIERTQTVHPIGVL